MPCPPQASALDARNIYLNSFAQKKGARSFDPAPDYVRVLYIPPKALSTLLA